MAGETIKSEAICLSVTPWSRTSHVVAWLTPTGRVGTVVKGAVRPKSAFLGQYDLNYTCELVYYARAKGDLHALRECAPVNRRDALRDDYAALALAGYFRFLADRFAPQGPECAEWYGMMTAALDAIEEVVGAFSSHATGMSRLLCDASQNQRRRDILVAWLLKIELRVLHLLGLDPEIEAESGAFALRGERKIPIPPEVAAYIRDLSYPSSSPFASSSPSPFASSSPSPSPFAFSPALDAARALGVYYDFHVDGVSDVRRAVLRLIHNKTR